MMEPDGGTGANGRETWSATDSVVLWAWALGAAACFTAYEEFLGGESGHPSKFWTDRVPGYFAATLVFTAVVLALSRLAARAAFGPKGWRGVVATAVTLAIAFPLLMPSPIGWWDGLRAGAMLALVSLAYLLPPALIAAFLRRPRRAA